MKVKYILSLSGGKDSVALLIYLLNNKDKYPLNEVVNCNMINWEFDCIESILKQCKQLCELNNIKYTEFKIDIDSKFPKYSWCGGVCRWGTTLKTQTLKKYYEDNYPNYTIVEYLGYAKGEESRIKRNFKNTIQIYPLIENGLSENDCLVMCYKNGFSFEDTGKRLYDYLDRVSCKYCKNKNLKELKSIYLNFPSYWEDLKNKQDTTDRQYNNNYTLEELEVKFKELLIDKKSSSLKYVVNPLKTKGSETKCQ